MLLVGDALGFVETSSISAPWASFGQIGGVMLAAGFTIRAIRIYSDSIKSDNASGVIQSFMSLIFGLIGYAVVTTICNNL